MIRWTPDGQFEPVSPLVSASVSVEEGAVKTEFTKIPLKQDPLKGVAGLSWFQRKPSSLTPEEWRALDQALKDGKISTSEYVDWKQTVS